MKEKKHFETKSFISQIIELNLLRYKHADLELEDCVKNILEVCFGEDRSNSGGESMKTFEPFVP